MKSKKPVQRKLKGPTRVKSKAKARPSPIVTCACGAVIYVTDRGCPFCDRETT